jgi:hypothetical protein
VNLIDPSGLKEWRPSTSREERIIGRLYELGRPEIHLEYSLPGGIGRIDIVNSITGDVWELKPFDRGMGVFLAEVEAAIYAEALNRHKAGTILGGTAGLLPQVDPNSWNSVDFHLGVGFPAMYVRGGTVVPSFHGYGADTVHALLDLLVFSLAPGSVTYLYIPKPEAAGTALAAWWACSKSFSQKLLPLPQGASPVFPLVPEILVDPSHPYSPANPLNCWKYPELCAPPVEG